jgi:hypothetical protein
MALYFESWARNLNVRYGEIIDCSGWLAQDAPQTT